MSFRHSACCLAVTIVVVASLPTASLRAQQAGSDQAQRASALLQAGKWMEAATVLRSILAADPTDATAWLRLGLALEGADEHEPANAALLRAYAIRPQPGVAYRVAVSAAKLGRKPLALAFLDTAMALGFGNVDAFRKEGAFRRWADDPDFRELPSRIAAISRPCESRPEYAQLDFWRGTWDQRGALGQVVGETIITPALSGCALVEQTRNPPLYTATAFHYFSPTSGTWRQHYLDSSGADLYFTGQIRGDTVVYTQDSAPVRGRVYRNTLVREDSANVRWRAEVSSDSGRSWRVTFDGRYVRRPTHNPAAEKTP